MRSSGPESGGSSGAPRGQHSREGATRFPDGRMSRGQTKSQGRSKVVYEVGAKYPVVQSS